MARTRNSRSFPFRGIPRRCLVSLVNSLGFATPASMDARYVGSEVLNSRCGLNNAHISTKGGTPLAGHFPHATRTACIQVFLSMISVAPSTSLFPSFPMPVSTPFRWRHPRSTPVYAWLPGRKTYHVFKRTQEEYVGTVRSQCTDCNASSTPPKLADDELVELVKPTRIRCCYPPLDRCATNWDSPGHDVCEATKGPH